VLRVGARSLESEGETGELPADPLVGDMVYSRGAGPLVCTAGTHRYHVEKRSRRLRQLSGLVEALAQRSGGEGSHGVVVAGHLGVRAQSRVARHGLPSLRLASAYPLSRRVLLDFFKGRDEILVLEEGEAYLEEALQIFAYREGLTTKVRGAEGLRPLVLDDERIDKALARFCGAKTALPEVGLRDAATWQRAYDAVDAIAADDGEPWPLYIARTRRTMRGLAAEDRRGALLAILRKLDRPTIIVGEPGSLSVLAIRDRLVDVKMHMGSAAPIAGALADAAEVEERTGAPLAVALMSDTSQHHSGLLGMLDNAISKREVLHIVVVHPQRLSAQGAIGAPALDEAALEETLRGAGMQVSSVSLSDPGLPNAVALAASRMGPRVLLCVDDAHEESSAE
jgi:TPP-dependent indolepyruvate ferredoxin oxidoreductase alpha subunit